MKRLLNFCRPFFDRLDDGGGAETITPEDFAKLAGTMGDIAAGQKTATEKAENAVTSVEKMEADMALEMAKVGSQLKLLKAALGNKYGASGTEDWLMEMAKFMAGLWQHSMSKGGKVDPALVMSNGQTVNDLIHESKNLTIDKAVVDFTTAETASAAVLLPTILRPGITELKDIFGNIYPRVTKFTVPAGHNVDANRDLTNPVAAWRTTQLTDMVQESTPMAFAKQTINTMLAGSWIQCSNELIKSPHINFAAVATVRMVRAILKLVETSLLAGDDGVAGPADGILNYTGVNDQGNIATATFANVVTFLQACLVDNDYASDEGGNQLMMTPTDALSLAAEAVGAAELVGMLVWGDPRKGIPTTLLGREVLQHPSLLATNRHIALGDLASILMGEDAAYTIDVNPWVETAFKENASWIRVFNHYDWIIGQPDEFHFSTVGA